MEGEDLVLIHVFATCDVIELYSVVSGSENRKLISIFF